METLFHWLNQPKEEKINVTFGAPWARRTVQRTDFISVKNKDGKVLPAQFKPLAYWPDGSVKWTAVSTKMAREDVVTVCVGENEKEAEILNPVTVKDEEDGLLIRNGLVSCKVSKGEKILSSFSRKGFPAATGRLMSYIAREEKNDFSTSQITYPLTGQAEKVTAEETGPVRSVIRVDGKYQTSEKAVEAGLKSSYFPFTLRLYFYADSDEVRMVHTFGIDLDAEKDLLKGICVELDVPSSGELYNRHIGFVSEDGIFYEGCQNMFRGGGAFGRVELGNVTPLETCADMYRRQVEEGQFVEIDPVLQADFKEIVSDNASWNRFILRQDSPGDYSIEKNTREGCAFIHAAVGRRSPGTLFYGNPSFILAAGVKDFWQKAPRALEISDVREDTTAIKLWLYSPYGQAFDFGAYDTVQHPMSYAGMYNFPEGICNTNELSVKLFAEMPGKAPIASFGQDLAENLVPVATPSVYEKTGVFGTYWLPGKNAEKIDRLLLDLIDFYAKQAEERGWYGFWDYGDVMHTYDYARHTWRYDIGGQAWHNTELCNTYMEWIAFLRTGSPLAFQLACAMTRHCSEVDTYHFGPYIGLGSRHNVRHWGDNCKEPRIAMAGHNRFCYYLTADERLGDVMDMTAQYADITSHELDDMGKTFFEAHTGKDKRYSHQTCGPHWTSFASNWMTAWERHEDEHAKKKLLTGLKTIAEAPLRFTSGTTFHYEIETGAMYYMGNPEPVGHTHRGDGNHEQHMVVCFGGPEMLFELNDWMEADGDPLIRDMLAEFGSYSCMTEEERFTASGGRFHQENRKAWGGTGGGFYMRLISLYGVTSGNERALQIANKYLSLGTEELSEEELKKYRFEDLGSSVEKGMKLRTSVTNPLQGIHLVTEPPFHSTNSAAQGALNLVETDWLLSK